MILLFYFNSITCPITGKVQKISAGGPEKQSLSTFDLQIIERADIDLRFLLIHNINGCISSVRVNYFQLVNSLSNIFIRKFNMFCCIATSMGDIIC